MHLLRRALPKPTSDRWLRLMRAGPAARPAYRAAQAHVVHDAADLVRARVSAQEPASHTCTSWPWVECPHPTQGTLRT